jgi:hypothetical protein
MTFYPRWAGVDPATGMWYKDVLGTDGLPTGERETTQNTLTRLGMLLINHLYQM